MSRVSRYMSTQHTGLNTIKGLGIPYMENIRREEILVNFAYDVQFTQIFTADT